MEHCSARPTETFDMSLVNSFWLIPNFHPQAAPPETAGRVQQVNFTDREERLKRAKPLPREETDSSNLNQPPRWRATQVVRNILI